MGRCATQALPGFDRCVSTFILQCTGEQVCIFATMPAYQTSCHGKICNPGSARLRQMLVYVRFSVGEILFLSNLGYQTICRVCANMDRCLYACLFQNQCGDVQLRLCQASTYARLRSFPSMRKIVSEKYAKDCCMKYFARKKGMLVKKKMQS